MIEAHRCRITIELTFDEMGQVSCILDRAAPNSTITRKWDNIYKGTFALRNEGVKGIVIPCES